MGHIIKRTDRLNPRYYAKYKDPSGKWRWEGGFKLKKDAEALLKRREREIADGTFGREQIIFRDYYTRWMAGKKGKLKPSTYASYEHTFRNHILPYFSDMPIRAITPHMIQDWVSHTLSKGLSAATVQKAYRYLRACLRSALAQSLIDSNPCIGIDLPRVSQEEMDFLTPAEITRVLEKTRDPERVLFAVLAYSGLRLGEALALRWSSVRDSALLVQRSYAYPHGFAEPKTDSSRRAVPIMPILEELLLDYYQEDGRPESDTLMFTLDGENPLDPSNVRRRFLKSLKEANIRHVTMHSLRHGFASLMLSSGASVKALQRALGHANASMTLNVYTHLIPEDMEASLLRADRLCRGSE